MKKSKFFLALTIALSFSLMSMRCEEDAPREGEDADNAGPVITINTPSANAVFYTDGGVDFPDYIVITADATDDSKIDMGSVTVYNDSGMQVKYYEETSSTQNGISIIDIYTSFRTIQPGNYTLEFKFEDILGNSSTVTRNVTCEYSEPSGGTDG
ncbi:hypothetical protein [Winogradskyella sp. SYSU M77433]|uniref:hypothetical protein n=1 Tax=Winogradskyella sp. SYSU M77433 TaxID=3042722 RepID=UPI002480E5C2|nr:hypothetical protein [Winogradskyella sp. SYSU M77433]MDH7911284.1 hypothetical protein [Winogradskyella sp. SYSU M77433]